MPALSAVLLIFSFQFQDFLLFFNISLTSIAAYYWF